MNMTSDYEDPGSFQSGYGSMRHSSQGGKVTYIRRTPKYAYARSLRGSRDLPAKGTGVTMYFGFIVMLCALNLAATCYLIVSNETRGSQQTQLPDSCGTVVPSDVTESLEHLKSNVNTMMTALTYTLPQVLNNNKLSIQTRLSLMASEIRDILRRNYMNLDVKFGLNRTVILKTGQSGNLGTLPTTPREGVPHPTDKDQSLVTLVPRIDHPRTRDLPFTKVDTDSELDKKVKITPFYQTKSDHYDEDRLNDLTLLNPVI
ncbi:transmembrane protein [Ninapo virus]|nr:transmembrane protein [Ninapo virus]